MRQRVRHSAPPGTSFDPVRVVAELRKHLPPDQARALAEQIELERRAYAKFADPTRMLFERTALEQATSPGCARWHALQVPEGASVADYGCGIGADSLAFAAAGRRTVAIEMDETRAALAAHNLAVNEARSAVVLRADARHAPTKTDVVYFDPDRRPDRASGRPSRVFSLHETAPSWNEIVALRDRAAKILVKSPPAIPDDEIPAGVTAEFLSEGGECRECLLHVGGASAGESTGGSEGAGRGDGERAAVLVESGERRIIDVHDYPVSWEETGDYLADPDPALRRAGGVDGLAREWDAVRVAADSTYLFLPAPVVSPWARVYRVREVRPFRPKDLAKHLRAAPPRELVIKQRGVSVKEAELRRRLPTSPEGDPLVLVLFPRGKSVQVALCDPPEAPTGA